MKYSRIILIAGWIGLTISMATWWLIYGLKQIERNASLGTSLPTEVIRNERMLHWEGGSLILLLLCGGLGLFYYSVREFRRNHEVKQFFATLTHELKTPLASLRLQVESLQEDLAATPHAKLIDRLAGDAGRLELQLENALFLASVEDSEQLHLEKLKLQPVLENLKSHWPNLTVHLPEKIAVRADTRALDGILKNLIQNARVHGQATVIKVSAERREKKVHLSIEDNGQGFKGDSKRLAKLFVRHTTSSGSGVGLYLVKTLTEKMHGRISFEPNLEKGFVAHIILEASE